MSEKCPKCGSNRVHTNYPQGGTHWCPDCLVNITDWQQQRIAELEAEARANEFAQKDFTEKCSKDISEREQRISTLESQLTAARETLREIREHCNVQPWHSGAPAESGYYRVRPAAWDGWTIGEYHFGNDNFLCLGWGSIDITASKWSGPIRFDFKAAAIANAFLAKYPEGE